LGDSSVFKAAMIEEKADPMHSLCSFNHMTQNYYDYFLHKARNGTKPRSKIAKFGFGANNGLASQRSDDEFELSFLSLCALLRWHTKHT
jgi:hypothetical protein